MELFAEDAINVREMEDTDSDYSLMLKWLTDDRILEFYDGRDNRYTLDLIKQKYSPRILGEVTVIPCIIEYEEKPVGFIQFYLTKDHLLHDLDPLFGKVGTYGVDMFIGEPDLWGKGIGSKVLKMMAAYLLKEKGAVKIIIDPTVNNLRAIRSYEKAGFKKLKIIPGYELHEGEKPDISLMVYEPSSE